MYGKKSDMNIDRMKPMFTLGRCLGVLPLKLSGNLQFYRYLHPLIIVAISLIIFVTNLRSKMQFGKYLEPTAHFIDVGADIVFTVTNVASVLGTSLWRGSDVLAFQKEFDVIDEEYRNIKTRLFFPTWRLFLEMTLYHILFLIYFVYNAYTWNGTFGVTRCEMLRDLQCYHIIIMSLLLRYYAVALKHRFQLLNELLSKIGHTAGEVWSLNKIMRIYTKLSLMVEQYNNVFGWNFIFLYITIVITILMPANFLLVYAGGEKELAGKTFGVELIALCVIWTALPIGLCFAIFTAGEQGAIEAAKTPSICYNLINHLSLRETKDSAFKDDLLELANQATSKAPHFSAAGFFCVNYSVLFSLIGSISSYLIVLIQFDKQ